MKTLAASFDLVIRVRCGTCCKKLNEQNFERRNSFDVESFNYLCECHMSVSLFTDFSFFKMLSGFAFPVTITLLLYWSQSTWSTSSFRRAFFTFRSQLSQQRFTRKSIDCERPSCFPCLLFPELPCCWLLFPPLFFWLPRFSSSELYPSSPCLFLLVFKIPCGCPPPPPPFLPWEPWSSPSFWCEALFEWL